MRELCPMKLEASTSIRFCDSPNPLHHRLDRDFFEGRRRRDDHVSKYIFIPPLGDLWAMTTVVYEPTTFPLRFPYFRASDLKPRMQLTYDSPIELVKF